MKMIGRIRRNKVARFCQVQGLFDLVDIIPGYENNGNMCLNDLDSVHIPRVNRRFAERLDQETDMVSHRGRSHAGPLVVHTQRECLFLWIF